jgi:iron complex transport system substrate-binding protein
MLSDIGAWNIADENGSLLESLSLEAILLEDPAHIFVVTMGSDTELALNAFYRMTEENVAWGSLTAVREGRVHIMDKTLFNQKPNARYLEAYETLLEKLLTK